MHVPMTSEWIEGEKLWGQITSEKIILFIGVESLLIAMKSAFLLWANHLNSSSLLILLTFPLPGKEKGQVDSQSRLHTYSKSRVYTPSAWRKRANLGYRVLLVLSLTLLFGKRRLFYGQERPLYPTTWLFEMDGFIGWALLSWFNHFS